MNVGQLWTLLLAGTEGHSLRCPGSCRMLQCACWPRSLEKEATFPLTPSRAEMMEGPEPVASSNGKGTEQSLQLWRSWESEVVQKGTWAPLGNRVMGNEWFTLKHWVQNKMLQRGELSLVSQWELWGCMAMTLKRRGRELTFSIILLHARRFVDSVFLDSCDSQERQSGVPVNRES